MTVRIGSVELIGVQSVQTEEMRTLVEQRVPEQQGSVFQDLGREPITILLDGELFGPNVLTDLEKLRQAQAKAEPMSFAADVAVGTELTDVLVADIRMRQVAGYRDRYRFRMLLREYVRQPQPADTAVLPVNAAVQDDADAWGKDRMAAAAVLQDPASLPSALAANPALLGNLDMDELGDAVARNSDAINPSELNGLLEAVASADPAKASQLFARLQSAGTLGEMLAKYAQEGIAFIGKLDPLMTVFANGLDLLTKLKKVADEGSKLVATIGALRLPEDLAALLQGRPA